MTFHKVLIKKVICSLDGNFPYLKNCFCYVMWQLRFFLHHLLIVKFIMLVTGFAIVFLAILVCMPSPGGYSDILIHT